MRQFFLSIVLVFFAFVINAQSSKELAKIHKKFVPLAGNLMVAKYEVSNAEYRAFLVDAKVSMGADEYAMMRVDSSLWDSNYSFRNALYAQQYHSHAAYSTYPVVNIRGAAMDRYCKWLTAKYNANSKRKFKQVLFRLPTEAEWIQSAAAQPGADFPWTGKAWHATNKKGQKEAMANVSASSSKDILKFGDGYAFTSPAGSYRSNPLGVFDIIGNVAELTADGKIKGGSWANQIYECAIGSALDFQLPDPRVGFRVIMEIIEP